MARRAARVGFPSGATAALALCGLCALWAAAGPVAADTLLAARTIRAQSVVTAADLGRAKIAHPGAVRDPAAVVGLEAKVNIYPGRPIVAGDFGPPAIVERNQIVNLNYFTAGLSIVTEGRSLGRAGPGERLRVMNLSSRTTVTGTVLVDGSVNVTPPGS